MKKMKNWNSLEYRTIQAKWLCEQFYGKDYLSTTGHGVSAIIKAFGLEEKVSKKELK